MDKQTYQSFRANARANGFAYALRTHGLPLYEQGLVLILNQQEPDLFAFRNVWLNTMDERDTVKKIILATTPFKKVVDTFLQCQR